MKSKDAETQTILKLIHNQLAKVPGKEQRKEGK